MIITLELHMKFTAIYSTYESFLFENIIFYFLLVKREIEMTSFDH